LCFYEDSAKKAGKKGENIYLNNLDKAMKFTFKKNIMAGEEGEKERE
jgi:hypothetical protein